MKIKKIAFRKFLPLFLISITAIAAQAQLPQNIEPGQHQKSVNLFEQPEYIILIVMLLAILIGYYVYKRRKK